jgi:alpha-beta hydrolase superfamily lysophospholipase
MIEIILTTSRLSGFVNQGSIQVEVLGQLASKIRSGKYSGTIGAPQKLVLVGHSFGSYISHSLLANSPEIADGAALTGLAFAIQSPALIEALNLRVASLKDNKWKGLDSGYLIWDDIYGNINK